MTPENDITGFIKAFERGATADMLQPGTADRWGPIWTVPPCDPRAMERVAVQFIRGRAERLRHVRRAVINIRRRHGRSVVVITELPIRKQQVFCLRGHQRLTVHRYLQDDSLAALEKAFVPARAQE